MNWTASCILVCRMARAVLLAGTLLACSVPAAAQPQPAVGSSTDYLVNDSHCHLTNYIQEGTDIRDFLKIMGTKVGRVVRPVKDQAAIVEAILADPAFNHVYVDISWDEVAKYLGAKPDSTRLTAEIINRYPDRFLFGTDEVAPDSQEKYLRIYDQYRPLWDLLDKEASEKVRKGNYERIFDEGRRKVRAWEQAHVRQPRD
jgi:hypothetical protein